MSYHDKIQKTARKVEAERDQTYSINHNITLKWSETELEYLYGALYKILRVKNETCVLDKAKDDIVDAYNYLALFFRSISK